MNLEIGDNYVGFDPTDIKYKNVGRKEGEITLEITKCNNSPNTLSYLTAVLEKGQRKDKPPREDADMER